MHCAHSTYCSSHFFFFFLTEPPTESLRWSVMVVMLIGLQQKKCVFQYLLCNFMSFSYVNMFQGTEQTAEQ